MVAVISQFVQTYQKQLRHANSMVRHSTQHGLYEAMQGFHPDMPFVRRGLSGCGRVHNTDHGRFVLYMHVLNFRISLPPVRLEQGADHVMCRAVHPWQAAAIHEWMDAGYFTLRDVHAAGWPLAPWQWGWRASLHGTGCRCLCSQICLSCGLSLSTVLLSRTVCGSPPTVLVVLLRWFVWTPSLGWSIGYLSLVIWTTPTQWKCILPGYCARSNTLCLLRVRWLVPRHAAFESGEILQTRGLTYRRCAAVARKNWAQGWLISCLRIVSGWPVNSLHLSTSILISRGPFSTWFWMLLIGRPRHRRCASLIPY